jgi:catechol 2,3-dioxygenase-like lactoylglutathione lyase family enzyme
MLKSRPIIAFVATIDPQRAKAFYAGTLGLRVVSEDAFAIALDAGGTMLRVMTVQALQPAAYTALGWIVPDIRKAVRDLSGRHVRFQRYEGMGQDEAGIWTSPSGAKVAWFQDPDGNTLSVTEFDSSPTRLKRRPARVTKSARPASRPRRKGMPVTRERR